MVAYYGDFSDDERIGPTRKVLGEMRRITVWRRFKSIRAARLVGAPTGAAAGGPLRKFRRKTK